MDLIGCEVIHKSFGNGSVVEQSDEYITIKFLIGIKKFLYPDVFENFMTITNLQIQEKLNAEIEEKKRKIAEEKNRMQVSQKNLMEVGEQTKLRVSRNKRTYSKENIAFKCNFCDAGKHDNGIGFCGVCSDEIIRYNIEVAKHNWCCDEESPCSQYYHGIIDRKRLDNYMLNDGFVCYESQMLRSWAAFAGYVHTKENYQKPMKLNKIQINSLAILTTREPYALEKDRFVFGVFIVDEAYEGDNREQGYVTTSSKYKLSLSLDDAKKILFWNYYHNDNAPEKVVWSQGLHRYITNLQAACILRDIVKIKENTFEEQLAKEFLEYFCKINRLEIKAIPEADGALKR